MENIFQKRGIIGIAENYSIIFGKADNIRNNLIWFCIIYHTIDENNVKKVFLKLKIFEISCMPSAVIPVRRFMAS